MYEHDRDCARESHLGSNRGQCSELSQNVNLKCAVGVLCSFLWVFHGFSVLAEAQNQGGEPESIPKQVQLPDVEVSRFSTTIPEDPVQDRRIRSGKKVTSIQASEVPPLAQNSHRQILAEVPGLIISDVNNDSWASFTYRGMGDPHESFNVLNVRNGVPSTPDPYGYPAAYYVPPFAAVERVEFYRGGAGLLFGPQPGGSINYILRQAPKGESPSKFRTTNLGGAFGRYSSYSEYSVGKQNWGALVSFNSSGAQGFRDANGFSRVINPRLNYLYSFDESSHLRFDFDMYQGRFGEPGGLAKNPGANVLTLDNPKSVTLRNDQIEIDRTGVVFGWEKDWSSDTSSLAEVWSTHFRRESYRQNLGGSPAFGGIATGTTNVIQDQRFHNQGMQAQVQHDYLIGDQRQVLTFHAQFAQTVSPLGQEAGSSPQSREGTATRDIVRKTQSQALVVENAYKTPAWTITPALRLESIRQEIDERLNTLGSVPLRQEQKDVSIGLFGLGVEYGIVPSLRIYGNYSQGYKPPAFQDSVPLGTTDTISEDLREARTENYELGMRGSSKSWEYDISVFRIDYSNIFGRVGSNFQNVGTSRAEGLDMLLAQSFSSRWKGFISASLLDSKFVNGPQSGKKTQYSPDQVFRAGVTYAYSSQSFVRLQGQSLSSYFGDDANSPGFALDAMTVADLAGQHSLGRWQTTDVSINWGINNLFDQKTPTRVRSNGYEPAQPIAAYGGLTFVF